MKLQLAPPSQGMQWVRQAFRIFARQPIAFAALFAACLFVCLLLIAIPLLGSFLLLLLAPTGTIVFMIATRLVLEGKRPMPDTLLQLRHAGRARLLGLFKLGLVYLAAAIVIHMLSSAVDGGALAAFMESMGENNAAEQSATRLADPRLQAGLLLRMTLAALVSVPFWHAPALVFWSAQSWAKALFSSTVAIWRNKAAFAVYGIAWMLLGVVFLVVASIGAGLLGPQRFTFIGTPLTLVLLTVYYASLYFTFADSFAASEPEEMPLPRP